MYARLPRLRPRRSTRVLLAAITAATLSLSACSATSATSGTVHVVGGTSAGGYRGDQLSAPVQLSAASGSTAFASTNGGRTTLDALGKNHLMLVYFGYTHCPDVCPTTMADIGLALRQIPAQVRQRVQVVFVTSDPARDTTPVLKAWLAHFDAGLSNRFVGLTGPLPQIDRVARSIGVPLEPPKKQPDGSITVQHGAQTLAFDSGAAHLVWLADTSSADYASDITQLVQDRSGS